MRRTVLRAIAAAFLLTMATPAHTHGEADWINQGQYRNAIGELCCGERDCQEIDDGAVSARQDGYYLYSHGELVPYREVLPSPDGRYWRCAWGGVRKCFFAPPKTN